LALGWMIDSLQKDFTLNTAANNIPTASAELVGTTTPATNPAIAIDCIRTVPASLPSCPQTANFAPVDSLTIDETLTTQANSIVTALTDTIGQIQVVKTPEPVSLALFGVGLLGLGVARRVKR